MLASAGLISIRGDPSTELRAGTGGSRMRDLGGRLAVVTGGGSGMGRELVRQLVAEGCNVAMCDVSADSMAETRQLCANERSPPGARITAHVVDVSDETQVLRF